MAFINDYSWTRPRFNNGRLTRWAQILQVLSVKPMTKRQLLVEIWNRQYEDIYTWEFGKGVTHTRKKFPNEVKHMDGTWRGFSSKLFACMHEDNLICYDPATCLWQTSTMGRHLINIYGL